MNPRDEQLFEKTLETQLPGTLASGMVRYSSIRPLLVIVLLMGYLALLPTASAQYWQLVKSIGVGESPERMAVGPGGGELYVTNRASCSVSIIDMERNETMATIELGKSPSAIVAGGNRLYVLEYDPEGGQRCPGQNRAKDTTWTLAIIDTAQKTLASSISLPFQRMDQMALAADGRLFMTVPYQGVFVFDTVSGRLQTTPVITDTCPIGIAISAEQSKLFVNFQCIGPTHAQTVVGAGNIRIGHDSIAVYKLSPPYEPIAVITGLPNVGGQLALSPDGSDLWADGNDACSRPDYSHEGCPGFPVRVVNIINTSDLSVRSYGFSISESDGRISFSPEGEAFVGGGDSLKQIPKPALGVATRLPIPAAGDVAFRREGKAELMYVAVSNKNTVQVMTRSVCECDSRGFSPPTGAVACISDERKKQEAAISAAPGKNYALVVGINEYDNWPHLANPTHDADDVTKELRESYNFEVQELPGRVAKNDLRNALYGYGRDAKDPHQRRHYNDQDQLLIYIASHGTYDEAINRGFLIASDSKTSADDVNHLSQLSHTELREILDTLPIKHIFVMIDACFAGTFDPLIGGALRGSPDDYAPIPLAELRTRNASVVTREVLTSGSKEFVPDGSSRNSPFSQIFLQALRSPGIDGYLTVAKLKPQFQRLHTTPFQGPFGNDNGKGEFFFVHAGAVTGVTQAANPN
jgi:YVTN family beta-propeller protein